MQEVPARCEGRWRIKGEEVGLGSWVGLLWAVKTLSLGNQPCRGRRRHRPAEGGEVRQSSLSPGKPNPP